MLVQVWHVASSPEFYIFKNIEAVERALGKHAKTKTWNKKDGEYTVTGKPGPGDLGLMQPHRDRWENIIEGL